MDCSISAYCNQVAVTIGCGVFGQLDAMAPAFRKLEVKAQTGIF
jgi:hypothetical protein